ncbi:hypothetical protein [Nocardioides zeae]
MRVVHRPVREGCPGDLYSDPEHQRQARGDQGTGDEPPHALPQPRLGGLTESTGGGDGHGGDDDDERRFPHEHDQHVSEARGEQQEQRAEPEDGRADGAADAFGPPRSRLVATEVVDLEQRVEQPAGQARGRENKAGADRHPTDDYRAVLDDADRERAEGCAVAADDGEGDLAERHDQCDQHRQPEGDAVEVCEPGVSYVGGEEAVQQLHDGLHRPQSGGPDRQHRRGPHVRQPVLDCAADVVDRVEVEPRHPLQGAHGATSASMSACAWSSHE